MTDNDALKAELKRIGLSITDLANRSGIQYKTLAKKLAENTVKHKDIIKFGRVIKSSGGDPDAVWTNWTALNDAFDEFPIKTTIIPDKLIERLQVQNTVPLVDGSYLNKPSQNIFIPTFENLDYWIRIYNSDILCNDYKPGQVFGIKRVENFEDIIYGRLYHFYCSKFESLRIIKKGSDKYILTLIPLNPNLDPHEHSMKSGKVEIFEVKGVITWI